MAGEMCDVTCDPTHVIGGQNIFSAKAGTLVVVDGDAAPVVFTIDGHEAPFWDLKAIVTSVGIQGQGGYQFMHAVREFIYVYVFTERVGEIVVNGLAFPAACNIGPGPQGPQDPELPPGIGEIPPEWEIDPPFVDPCITGQTGLERILTWYDCNRITTRARPITIAFGNVAYETFLVGQKAEILNADTGIAQFSFRFNFIPNISDADEFCFPMDENCLWWPCGPQDGGAGLMEDQILAEIYDKPRAYLAVK